jgi:HPt (histidine-containing phosphotransfer) domain-containing protein
MEQKITNLDYLNEISAGDRRLVLEMITIFNAEVPCYLKSMNQLLEAGNWEALGKLAHKAKASASIMGMNETANDLKYLEELANKKKDIDKYSSYVSSIEKKFKAAMEELKLISKTI